MFSCSDEEMPTEGHFRSNTRYKLEVAKLATWNLQSRLLLPLASSMSFSPLAEIKTPPSLLLHDLHPSSADLGKEVLAGLSEPQKTLPCKLLYDQRGSQLFDQICALEEYYPTRTEMALLHSHIDEMVSALGPACVLAELGSGSSIKTRILLDALPHVSAYVPIDISRSHLLQSAQALLQAYPKLKILPVCADFSQDFSLPLEGVSAQRTVIYYPGSSIGNFKPQEVRALLSRMGKLCGAEGALLIGADLPKDIVVLERAYNDSQGVTAEFNLNMLRHINQTLAADFDLSCFRHHAFFNEQHSRIEMHLISSCQQTVHINDTAVRFEKGESIHTENSYKYSLETFAAMAAEAGFVIRQVWTDRLDYFSMQLLEKS